jgi:hypothetical protein
MRREEEESEDEEEDEEDVEREECTVKSAVAVVLRVESLGRGCTPEQSLTQITRGGQLKAVGPNL